MRYSSILAAVTFTGCFGLLLNLPGGIPEAEGCSGGGPMHYNAPGWSSASWAVDPTGVPIDGAVRIALHADYTPGPLGAEDGGTGAAIVVSGPDQAPVAGGPETAPAPGTVESSDAVTIITWRPVAPFHPSTNYTLHIDGLLGSPVDLPFTTGAQPFQPPKPVLTNPSLSASKWHFSGTEICCDSYSSMICENVLNCAGQMIQPAPSVSAQVDVDEPLPAAKTFFATELQVSVNGGPFVVVPYGKADFEGVTGKLCLRALATNTLTQAKAVTPEWCATTDTLDLSPSPNCDSMAAELFGCASRDGDLSPANASKIYEAVCGAAGAGGAQQDGGSSAGSSGAAGGAADVAQAGGSSSADSGCSMSRSRSDAGGGLAAVLFALMAVARHRASRRGCD